MDRDNEPLDMALIVAILIGALVFVLFCRG